MTLIHSYHDAQLNELSNLPDWLLRLFQPGQALAMDDQFRVTSDKPLTEIFGELNYLRNQEVKVSPEEYLQGLKDQVEPHVINVACPRFLGHMTSALPLFLQPLAAMLTRWNQNVVKTETSKYLTAMERQVLAEMHQLCYRQPSEFYLKHMQDAGSCLGAMATGGTVANLLGLWCGRNSLASANHPPLWYSQVGNQGYLQEQQADSLVIIGSELMHYSCEKGADILGLGMNQLLKVPVDQEHKIKLDLLLEAINKCQKKRQKILAIIGIAGTTDSGAIDPLIELARISREIGAWFHVDAAWGGPLLFSQKYKHLLEGIEQADSITIDAHKQMYAPLGTGMVLFKNPYSAKVIEKDAPYIIREGGVDLGKRSLEGSRPASIVYVDAVLRVLGHEGLGLLVDYGISLKTQFLEIIKTHAEFELLHAPQTNIVLYRYLPVKYRNDPLQHAAKIDQFNVDLQSMQRDRGKTFVSRTSIFRDNPLTKARVKTSALRAVFANPLTRKNDILAMLEDQLEIARELENQ
jgi:glutamate decarboxylase